MVVLIIFYYNTVEKESDSDAHSRKITYVITDQLSSGGFGAVFKGMLNEEPVAVKRILLYKDQTCEDREEKALKIFSHPNVVKLLHTEYDAHFK